MIELTIGCLLFILTLTIHSWRIYPICISFFFLLLYLIGLYQMNSSNLFVYTLGMLGIFLGYFFVKNLSKSDLLIITRTMITKELIIQSWIIFLIILFFTVYHFVAGGIPLFSPNVEINRFNYTSSGLFGLPGRIYLFGIPYIVIYFSCIYFRANIKKNFRFLFILAWVLLLISRILAGFKSAIIEVTLLAIIILALNGRPIKIVKIKNILLVSVLCILALAFAGKVAMTYTSLNISTPLEVITYLFKRFTEGASPVNVGMILGSERPSYFYYFKNDFVYFIQKYLNISLMSGSAFPFDKIVSSTIYKVPLKYDSFIVPVTVSALSELWANMGLVGLLIASILLGVVYFKLIGKIINNGKPIAYGNLGFIILMLHTYITKGGLIYLFINTSIMLVVLLIFNTCARIVSRIMVVIAEKQ